MPVWKPPSLQTQKNPLPERLLKIEHKSGDPDWTNFKPGLGRIETVGGTVYFKPLNFNGAKTVDLTGLFQ
jgi:hypothetical protein